MLTGLPAFHSPASGSFFKTFHHSTAAGCMCIADGKYCNAAGNIGSPALKERGLNCLLLPPLKLLFRKHKHKYKASIGMCACGCVCVLPTVSRTRCMSISSDSESCSWERAEGESRADCRRSSESRRRHRLPDLRPNRHATQTSQTPNTQRPARGKHLVVKQLNVL